MTLKKEKRSNKRPRQLEAGCVRDVVRHQKNPNNQKKQKEKSLCVKWKLMEKYSKKKHFTFLK
jgi:hypothetical protein